LGVFPVRRLAVLLLVLGVAAVLAGGAGAATTTLGNAVDPDSSCAGDTVYIPTGVSGGGRSYTVPAGNWVVTSWSAFGPSAGLDAALVIARKTATNTGTVIYSSADQNLTPGSVNTFPVANVPVKPGDVIGAWYGASTLNCADDVPGNTDEFENGFASPPPAGAPLNTTSEAGAEFDISATLSSGSTAKKVAPIPQVDHIFLCYSKFQTNPGVWDSGTAALLQKAGYWLPYALPGNLEGAANLGGYHLACNLTGTQTATGGFVDDGGGTWSADYAATPGLYPAATG
jgi:hypothetical protein